MKEPSNPRAVFLSYASQDAEAARRIADALRAFGVEVWFDQSELRSGDAWDQKIRRQIKECALFVPLISANTEARVEGYFRREWRLAVERTYDMADDAAFLVPVAVDDTSEAQARVPDRFRERQWTHLPGGETPPAFCERLRHLLAGPAGAAAPAEDVRVPEPREVPGWRPATGLTVPGTPWIMEAKLGEGGFGEVWLGRHQAMKEPRVFKFCFRAERVRSLKRELTLFRVLKERVGAHPNIVRLLDVHFDEPPYYVEMDYVEGQSLKAWCDHRGGVGRIPLATRLEIVAQIADALHAAHVAGVIHRDVKPGNILVSQPSTPGAPPAAKLSDFGIGQVLSAEVLEGVTKAGFTQSIVADASPQSGTQLYMAPELLAGEHATAQSDIYSLGVVLFQLLVGDLHRPLTTDWPRAIDDPCLREVLERCFAGKPEERFANAGQLASNLRSLPQRHAVLAERQAAAAAREKAARRWKIIRTAGIVALVVGLGASLIWFLHHNAKLRWAHEHALPEISRLIGEDNLSAAFALARQAEEYLHDDPALTALWPQISVVTTIETTPPGADIYLKEYRKPDSAWQYLGRSPLKGVRLARNFYRWQIKKEGHAVLERAGWVYPRYDTIRFLLDPADAVPAGMVMVHAGKDSRPTWWMTGLQYLPAFELGDYLIDQYEISNRQFKEFVDRGGYSTAGFWKQPFIKQGKELTWAEAMAEFRDATGRPGPATWKNGSYAEGEADYPVTGISWFEAEAYADSVGKRLPSLYHWSMAAAPQHSENIVPLSNFTGRGLARAGDFKGMSESGAYDMAGNAKEWCWNEASAGNRYILGGGFNEPEYMFAEADAISPFDRSPTNGFRCIKLVSAGPLAQGVDDPIVRPSRDFATEQPVSEEIYRIYKSLFSYDKTDLSSRTETVDDSDPRWRKEKVTFNAAYGNERVIAWVYVPKKSLPPFQAVIVFPGANAAYEPSHPLLGGWRMLASVVETGRVLIWPVYKGTWERIDNLLTSTPTATSYYRDHVIQWSKDLGRTIDYLETRQDIQADKLAYLGISWGASMGVLLPALENRIKAGVLIAGGFYRQVTKPEVDQINFAPRVTIPTLMVNGRYDAIFPVESSQRPMFRWLGAPAEHKRYALFDSGHIPLDGQIAQETNAWLDRYLGPVK